MQSMNIYLIPSFMCQAPFKRKFKLRPPPHYTFIRKPYTILHLAPRNRETIDAEVERGNINSLET